VARRVSYTLPERHVYSPNATTRVELPRSGYITEIGFLLRVQYDTGTAPSLNEDAHFRFWKSLRISAAGGLIFADFPDMRMAKFENFFRYKGQITEVPFTTAAGLSDQITWAYYILHLGHTPEDRFDRTIPIPARELVNLITEVTWADAAAIGTDYSVDNAEISINISELILEPGETREDLWPRGIPSPRYEPTILDIDAVYANLALEHNVPVGDLLVRSTIVITGPGPAYNRSDDAVTEIGIKFPKLREIPFRNDWRILKAFARSYFSVPQDVVGAILYPWSNVSGRPYGIDLSAALPGDVKFGFTTTAAGVNGQILILHFCTR